MTEAFELVRLRNGSQGIRSLRYGEVCHPGIGPMAEAESLYVRGLNLSERLRQESGEFVVWDVGLGGAANALTTIQAARGVGGRLRLISFDRSLAQLDFALRHADELEYFGDLAGLAGSLVKQRGTSSSLGSLELHWDCVVGDFPTWLASSASAAWPAPHAILFDPHSPATNPEMWTLPLFRALAARLAKDRPCALATYSRRTAVRVALLLAGLFVGPGSATAAKEETTLAANTPSLISTLLDARWLERARRSLAAEPWVASPYLGQPLLPTTWNLLREHPQFR